MEDSRRRRVQQTCRASELGPGTGHRGPACSPLQQQPAPRSNSSGLPALAPSLSLRPSFFSFLCPASRGVWALPSGSLAWGPRGTSQCQCPGSHIQPEEGQPLPHVCLSGSVRWLPRRPAVHRQKQMTRPRPTRPQRGQRQHSEPDTDRPRSSVFPKAPPRCWDHPSKQPSLPSISSRLNRSAKGYQGLPRIISTRHSPAQGPGMMLCHLLHPTVTPPSSLRDLSGCGTLRHTCLNGSYSWHVLTYTICFNQMAPA